MRSQAPPLRRRWLSHDRERARRNSCGFDHPRRAHGYEDRAFVECAEDSIQLERHFAKPADVRSNSTSAVAAGKLGWKIVGGRVVKWRSGASIAAALKQFAVHVDNAHRPCCPVRSGPYGAGGVFGAAILGALSPPFDSGKCSATGEPKPSQD
jgi:hypothetical protein